MAAADNLNFTKTAQQYHISQTAISQQIAALEEDLGVQLFERKGRRIYLTYAGRQFRDDCEGIINKYDSAVDNMQAIAKGMQGSLKIGVWDICDWDTLATMLIGFQEHFEHIKYSFTIASFSELSEMLKQGNIDVVFGFIYDINHTDDLEHKILLKDEVGAVVSNRHRLSEFDSLPANALASEKLVTVQRDKGPGIYQHQMSNLYLDGYEPNIALEVESMNVLILSVLTGDYVALLPKRLTLPYLNRLHYIHLEGTHCSNEVALAWKRNPSNPITRLFIKHTMDTFPQFNPGNQTDASTI